MASTIIQFRKACLSGNINRAESIFRRCDNKLRKRLSTMVVDAPKKRTTLHMFAMKGCVESVRAILSHGGNKDARDIHGFTPLITAIAFGNEPVMEELVSAGADVNMPENERITPIAFASEMGKLRIVDFLIEKGANPNICCKAGEYPLSRAAYEGHCDVMKRLVECGACVNITNEDGYTCLMNAITDDRKQVFHTLLEMGVNTNVAGVDGVTALHIALIKHRYDMIDDLLASGANPNVKDDKGGNSLTVAIVNTDARMVEKLLKYGGKVSKSFFADTMPVAVGAAFSGQKNIIELLLAAHRDIFHKTQMLDPITGACQGGQYAIVEVLLAMKGAYPIKQYERTKEDFSYLHAAAIHGRLDIAKLLIAAGEQKDFVNMFNMTPRDCAIEHGHEAIADLISDDSYPSMDDVNRIQERFVKIREHIQTLRDGYNFQ